MARNLKSGILITGDASGAVKATKLTREELQKLNESTGKANKIAKEHSKTLEKMSGIAATSAKALAGLGAAGAAAMAAIVTSSADAAKEIQIMSRLAGVSAEEFQAMSHAAATVGVQTDKFADIMKDVQDKVGDFLQNGGGPMKDFFDNIAPAVGVTAEQFKKLSGPEALQLYVSSLEKANLSNSEMTFYMEAIASDATLLLPLMENNAKAFNELGQSAKDAGLYLSEIDVQSLAELDNTFLQISQTFGTLTNIFAAELSPLVQALADDFLDATKKAGGYRNEIREIIQSTAMGAGYFFDWVRGMQVTALGFQALGVSAVGALDGIGNSIELLKAAIYASFKDMQYIMGNFMAEMSQSIEDVINHLIREINELIESVPFLSKKIGTINSIDIPAPNTDKLKQELDSANAYYQKVIGDIESGAAAVGMAWDDVFELMEKDLPSDQIKKRLQEIFEKADKVATDTADIIETGNQKVGASYDSLLDKVDANMRSQKILFEESAAVLEGAFAGAISAVSKQFGDFSGAAGSIFSGIQGSVSENGLSLNSIAQGARAGLPGVVANVISNSLGTIFDDNASNARRRNNIGFLTGGLGFLLPSSIFGKPSDKTQSAQIDLASGGITQGGFLSGSKFDQTNRDAADIAAQLLSSISAELQDKIGKDLAGELDFIVGSRDGVRIEFNGEELVRSTEISEVLNAASEKLFELADVSSEVYRNLQAEGETLAESLVRVDTQFETVNSIAETLGANLKLFGDEGLNAADAIVQAAGGLASFTGGMNYFYENFFSDAEKFENLTSSINDVFDEAGIAVPKTADEFKNLVLETYELGDAGAELLASLLKVSPSMRAYYTELDNQAAALDRQKEAYAQANNVWINDGDEAFVNLGESIGSAIEFAKQKIIEDKKIAAEEKQIREDELIQIREANAERRRMLAESVQAQAQWAFGLGDPVTGGGSTVGIVDPSMRETALTALVGAALVPAVAKLNEVVVEAIDTTRLEITLLKLQGKEMEALNLARQHELSQVSESEVAILQLIYAQEDLNAAKAEAAKLAVEEEKRAATLNTLIEGFEIGLTRLSLSDFEESMLTLDRSIDQSLKQAQALGATEEQLTIIRQYGAEQAALLSQTEAERLAAIEKAAEEEASAIKEANKSQLDGLLFDFAERFVKFTMTPLDVALYDLGKEVSDAIAIAEELGATEEQLSILRRYEAQQREALISGSEDAVEALKDVSAELQDLAGIALDRLKTSVASEKEQIKTLFDSDIENINNRYSDILENLKSNLDAVNDSVRSLSTLAGQLNSALQANTTPTLQSRQSAQAQLFSALGLARNGGSLAGVDLGAAINAVAQPSADLFSSYNDYLFDFNRSNVALTGLKSEADKQLDLAKTTTELLEDQIIATRLQHEREIELRTVNFEQEIFRLDSIVENAQSQLNALLNIDNSVLSLKDAMQGFATAIQNAQEESRIEAAAPDLIMPAPAPVAEEFTPIAVQSAKNQDETRQLLKSMARNTAKTARVLSKFDYDGMPAERV